VILWRVVRVCLGRVTGNAVFGMVHPGGMWSIKRMGEAAEGSESPGGIRRDQFPAGDPSGRRLPVRVAKASGIDFERVGDEIVLMHLTSLEFRLLNEVGALLWDTVEEIPEPAEWVEMMVEARPETPRETHEEHVVRFIEELVGAGFLVVEPRGTHSAG